MKFFLAVVGLLALLHSAAAWPQSAHSSHGKPATKEPDARPAAKESDAKRTMKEGEANPAGKAAEKLASAPQPVATPRDSASYRSPFAGYRLFTPDEPMSQWRAANDEVRESGGHVGLMKGKQ